MKYLLLFFIIGGLGLAWFIIIRMEYKEHKKVKAALKGNSNSIFLDIKRNIEQKFIKSPSCIDHVVSLKFGYGWDDAVSSASYIVSQDLNVSYISVGSGEHLKDLTEEYKKYGELSLMPNLRENFCLTIAGESRRLQDVLFIYYNQTNLLEIKLVRRDYINNPNLATKAVKGYMEDVVKKSFAFAQGFSIW